MSSVRLLGAAASVVAMYAELRDQDPEAFTGEDADLLIVLDAWDGRCLAVSADVVEPIASALIDLANGEDDLVEADRKQIPSRRDPEARRLARAACLALGRAADTVRRAGA